jgi:hypothetical protein
MNCAIFAISAIVVLSLLIVVFSMYDSKKESYEKTYKGFTRDGPAPPLSPFVTYKKYACPCNPQYILQQPFEFII